ncbi:MAG: hypothetical protein K2Q22_07705 [Cytophagales bacterium]|nr:hypothetical protein [Cytophagales bacterium]
MQYPIQPGEIWIFALVEVKGNLVGKLNKNIARIQEVVIEPPMAKVRLAPEMLSFLKDLGHKEDYFRKNLR